MVVAVASAVAVVAVSVVVLVLLAGRPSSQDDAATTTTTTTTTTTPPTTLPPPTVVPDTAPPLDGPGTSTGGHSGSGAPTGPRSGSDRYSAGGVYDTPAPGIFWSVVVDSKRNRSEAEAIAADLVAMGQPAQVDQSTSYASLKPGYWVVHVGRFSDEYSAYRAQQQLQENLGSAGYPDVYRRCFGDVPPCRENDPRIAG